MALDIALGRCLAFGLHVLDIGGKSNVCHFVIHGGRPASEFSDVLNMGWTHYARVVSSHIHKKTVQRNILLSEGVIQVVVRQSGNGQDGSAIEFGIIKSI